LSNFAILGRAVMSISVEHKNSEVSHVQELHNLPRPGISVIIRAEVGTAKTGTPFLPKNFWSTT
jgi:hypothetical protein